MQITRPVFAGIVGATLLAGGLGAVALSSTSNAATPTTLNAGLVDSHHQDTSPLQCPRAFPAATLTVTSNGTPYRILTCAQKAPVAATTTVTQTQTVTVSVTLRQTGSPTRTTASTTTIKQDPPTTSTTTKPDPPHASSDAPKAAAAHSS